MFRFGGLSVAIGVVSFCASSLSGEEVSFVAGPTAAKEGDKIRISFAMSAPTDVEVAIVNAQGRIVRRLAAGVLGGKNPPPEPLKPGLAQNLEWDGKDDAGKSAAGGPFKIHVRAGMSVNFGRIFGTSPYTGVLSSGGRATAWPSPRMA